MRHSVAIIMSVYLNDKLDYIKLSVDSILNQNYTDFDFYILFDGPIRDDVHGYLTTINDPRITIIERKINKGLAISLNELLQIVLPKGYEFVARMDADDISLPTRFERQIEFMNTHSDIDCIGTWAIEINADGSEYFHKQMPENHDECRELFKKRDCMIHPTVMFRHSYFDKAGLYPEDTYFGEDTMMWANGFASGCRFSNIPEYLFKFRLDQDFFNRRRGWKHAKSIYTLRKKVNKMLGFGIKADIYAILYASAKMMPKAILNTIYKLAR